MLGLNFAVACKLPDGLLHLYRHVLTALAVSGHLNPTKAALPGSVLSAQKMVTCNNMICTVLRGTILTTAQHSSSADTKTTPASTAAPAISAEPDKLESRPAVALWSFGAYH